MVIDENGYYRGKVDNWQKSPKYKILRKYKYKYEYTPSNWLYSTFTYPSPSSNPSYLNDKNIVKIKFNDIDYYPSKHTITVNTTIYESKFKNLDLYDSMLRLFGPQDYYKKYTLRETTYPDQQCYGYDFDKINQYINTEYEHPTKKIEPIIRNVKINLDVIYDILKKVSKQRQRYDYLDNVDVKIILDGKEYLLENTEYEIDNEEGIMFFKFNCTDPEHNPLDNITRTFKRHRHH